MEKFIKYSVFQTKWGYFGLAGTESALNRTQLPWSKKENVENRLLQNLTEFEHDKDYFKHLQEQIAAYFDGCLVEFGLDIPVSIDNLGQFGREVLNACRNVEFGQTITYSQLATKSGRPAAGRAVGNTLAKNPLPLIIPCHRVVRTDGGIGGFTAPGGTDLKVRLLEHEQQVSEKTQTNLYFQQTRKTPAHTAAYLSF